MKVKMLLLKQIYSLKQIRVYKKRKDSNQLIQIQTQIIKLPINLVFQQQLTIRQMSLQMSHRIDSRQLYRLQNQNYLLHQQLEDLRAKYDNLKKQQQIWQQINKHNIKGQQQTQQKANEQLHYLKEQFVTIVKEKQQQQNLVRQLRQKIDDLKYTIVEMKQLGQKQERIHQKQIQFLYLEKQKCQERICNGDRRSQHFYQNDRTNANNTKLHSIIKELQRKLLEADMKVSQLQDELDKQKQSTQKTKQKLQKCSEIAKEMQEYYNNQLQAKQQMIAQLQFQLNKYNYNGSSSLQNYELQSPKPKLLSQHLTTNEDCSSLKCSSIVSEYQHQQQLCYGNQNLLQERYEKFIEDIRLSHSKELSMHQEKIRYLMLKVEALQAEKKYLIRNTNNNNMSSQDSMMIDTMQSIQSFNHANSTNLNKPFKNTMHQQSVNLKLSKASINDSFTQFTPKSQISSSLIRQKDNSNRESNSIIIRPKLTSIKTPNKSVQKSASGISSTRNSCSYQRVVLGESNAGY